MINGYLFGIIVCSLRAPKPMSDSVGGAAEGIERPLLHFAHSGLLRLNFAAACDRARADARGSPAPPCQGG